MLTIEPARRRRAGRGKLAIALAGGGPLGAFYELGALHALSEAIVGRELDGFRRLSSASARDRSSPPVLPMASTRPRWARSSSNDESTLLPLPPEMLLHPAFGEYARRMALLPEVLAEHRPRIRARPAAERLARRLVSSLGRVAADRIVRQRAAGALSARGCSAPTATRDDFRQLRARLYVVATNLNTGESVAFGDAEHDHVPISRAVAASAALPGLYPAVDIDGQHVRRWRPDPHDARLARARGGLRSGDLHQSAGALRRLARRTARVHQSRRRGTAGDPRPDLPRTDPFAHAGRHGQLSRALSESRYAAARAGPPR